MKLTAYTTIDDFPSSLLWERLSTDTEPQVNTRVLSSTRLEKMTYEDLREQMQTGLDEIEADGTEKLDSFPSLLQDVFQSIYSLDTRFNDTDTLTANARHFNAEILDSVMSDSRYRAIKSLCEGNELLSYEAVGEFARSIHDKLDELLDVDALDKLNVLEQQQSELKPQVIDAMERGDPADDGRILSMAESIAENNQEIERLSRMIRRGVRKNKEAVQSAVASAVGKTQEVSGIINAWGNGDNSPVAIQQNAELLSRVQSSQKLQDIMKYLGKYREILKNASKSTFTYGMGEKYDIVRGKDYTRAIPSEYVYLALSETVPLFMRKVQHGALKQYRKRERTIKGFGDIVVCIDESGSMFGESISWAKAVALVLLEYATQNNRNCAMVRFASSAASIVTHIYKPEQYTAEDVFSFAESFLNGGTDFEAPLKKAVKLIEREGFENADIMFITDGQCRISDEFATDFREKSNQLKFDVTGIVIDADSPGMKFSLEAFCENVYRLSEMTSDDIAAAIITSKAL